MHPHPAYRRFEGPEGGPPEPPAAQRRQLDLPSEGKGVVLNRDIPCPCTSCAGCGGHVGVTAILWVDDWPVTTPEAGQPVLEYPEKVCRTLHVSIAPTQLDQQTACSEGCQIAPEEWQDANGAAFLSLCRAYTEETRRVQEAKRAAQARPARTKRP